jgi:hypothetical protein
VSLLKFRVVIGVDTASVKIFPLSSSAGSLKNHLGTGFYLGIFLIQTAGFLYWKIKTKRKPADACGRRRSEDPAGRKPEEAGDLLHGKPAELKRSFLYLSTTDFNTALILIS